MATVILATGSSQTSSSDIVLADGATMTVFLKGVAGRVSVAVELQDDAAGYVEIGTLSDAPGNNSAAIVTPGTYRFSRRLGTCGVVRA